MTAVGNQCPSPLGDSEEYTPPALPPRGEGAGHWSDRLTPVRQGVHPHPVKLWVLRKPSDVLMLAVGSSTGPTYTEMVRITRRGIECLELQQPSFDCEAVARRIALKSEVNKLLI